MEGVIKSIHKSQEIMSKREKSEINSTHMLYRNATSEAGIAEQITTNMQGSSLPSIQSQSFNLVCANTENLTLGPCGFGAGLYLHGPLSKYMAVPQGGSFSQVSLSSFLSLSMWSV